MPREPRPPKLPPVTPLGAVPGGLLINVDLESGRTGQFWRVWDGFHERQLPIESILDGSLWRTVRAPGQPVVLIVEHCHLVERRRGSLAQVFWPEELERLQAILLEDEVTLYEFPQALATRARKEGGYWEDEARTKTDKDFDPHAQRDFVIRRPGHHLRAYVGATDDCPPGVDLKRWHYPPTEQELELNGSMNRTRSDQTVRLNEMRVTKYGEHDEVDDVRKLLLGRFGPDGYNVVDRVSEETREHFGLERKKNDDLYADSHIKWSLITTSYAQIFEENGLLRRAPDGGFIGIRFLWNAELMSPSHFRSGTARSNDMYHGLARQDMRRQEGPPAEKVKYRYLDTPEQHRARRGRWSDFRKEKKELMRAFRNVGLYIEDGVPLPVTGVGHPPTPKRESVST